MHLLLAIMFAVVPCGQANRMAEMLDKTYGEHFEFGLDVVMQGHPKVHAVVYVNKKTGTWTLLTSPSAGILCVALSGDGFNEGESL